MVIMRTHTLIGYERNDDLLEGLTGHATLHLRTPARYPGVTREGPVLERESDLANLAARARR